MKKQVLSAEFIQDSVDDIEVRRKLSNFLHLAHSHCWTVDLCYSDKSGPAALQFSYGEDIVSPPIQIGNLADLYKCYAMMVFFNEYTKATIDESRSRLMALEDQLYALLHPTEAQGEANSPEMTAGNAETGV